MSDQQKETKAKKERKNIDAKQMLGTNVTSRFDYDQMERQRLHRRPRVEKLTVIMCSGNTWFVPAAARGKSAEAAAEGSQLGLTAARGLSSPLYNTHRARAVVTVIYKMMSSPLYDVICDSFHTQCCSRLRE